MGAVIKTKPVSRGKFSVGSAAKPGRTTSRPGSATDSRKAVRDLFVHKGTSGFVGDRITDRVTRNVVENAFVNREGWVFDSKRDRSFYEKKTYSSYSSTAGKRK